MFVFGLSVGLRERIQGTLLPKEGVDWVSSEPDPLLFPLSFDSDSEPSKA